MNYVELQAIPKKELQLLVWELVQKYIDIILVIFIDGLQATGKGTQLELFEDHFGDQVETVSSGIFYRIFTWLYLRYEGDLEQINESLVEMTIKGNSAQVTLNEDEVTQIELGLKELRSKEVGKTIGNVSALPTVLEQIISQQVSWVEQEAGFQVMDGRQAPHIKARISPEQALFAVYLYTSPEAVTERILARTRGIHGDLTAEEEQGIVADAFARDQTDTHRANFPALDLKGAIESGVYDLLIDTTDLTPLQVFFLILQGAEHSIQR